MLKLSMVLAAMGLALLMWSFVPSALSASGTAAVATNTHETAAAATGRALFAAKGCATCHVNDWAVAARGECCWDVGPDLTNYTNDPAFLRRWLADPPAVKPGTRMPNLNLAATEIEDLIAFLNEPR